jgi:hypothetical protein
MALIPEAVASLTGTATAGRLPVNGDTIANLSDRTQLVLTAPSSGTLTATVTAVKPCSQGSLHNLVASINAGSPPVVVGPIDSRYANAVSGLAVVNYSGTLTASTVYTTRV